MPNKIVLAIALASLSLSASFALSQSNVPGGGQSPAATPASDASKHADNKHSKKKKKAEAVPAKTG